MIEWFPNTFFSQAFACNHLHIVVYTAVNLFGDHRTSLYGIAAAAWLLLQIRILWYRYVISNDQVVTGISGKN